MKEYKVEEMFVMKAEVRMNEMARSGWEVIAVTHIPDSHFKMVLITFERER